MPKADFKYIKNKNVLFASESYANVYRRKLVQDLFVNGHRLYPSGTEKKA